MGSRARAIALTMLVLALGACGDGGPGTPTPQDDDRVTAEAWLADVCGATSAWIDDIMAMQTDLQANLDTSSVQAVKDTMVGYFDDVLASTDDMLEEIDAAGVPDVDDGQQVVDAISTGMADARHVLQDARDDAAALETDDPRAFSRDLQAIAQDVQTSMTDVGETMAQLQSPELDRAAEDVPECQELEQP